MGLLNYALLGVVLLVISKFLCDIGLNRVVYDHTPGVCREIFGVGDKGSEDIVVLRNSPYALISQGIHFPLMTLVNPETSIRAGKIFLYSFDENPENRALPLTIVAAKSWNHSDFHPSGLSVFEGTPDDKPVVFAVNTKMHTVEVFELEIAEAKLTHLKTIKDPLFRLVNNLVATGKDSFYLTNYLYSRHGALVFAEMLVPFVPFGSVLHYNGTVATQVLANLRGPNGVAMSRDGRYLYIALNLARTLQVYEIGGKPTELKLVGSVPLYSAPDNLNVDDDGNLWTGSQPIMYEAFLNLMDVEKHPRVAAQVLKITLKGGRFVEKVEEVFADSGAMLRLTSTAAAKAKRLLIGTVTHKAMSCELP